MMIGADIAQTGAESRQSCDNYRAGGWCCLHRCTGRATHRGSADNWCNEVTGHITSSYHLNTPLLASAEAQHRAVHQEDRQRAAA